MHAPKGYADVTPYLFVAQADVYIRFLVAAFGAVEHGRTLRPNGQVANSQLRIHDCMLMISEASRAYPTGSSAFYLYVPDVEAAMARAVAAGAREIMAVADMPYGDRQGGVRDPAGNIWWISRRLTDQPYD